MLIGMCVMSVIDANAVQPGETRRVAWEFAPPAQGYIELLKPGDTAEICEGAIRVGTVRILEFQY